MTRKSTLILFRKDRTRHGGGAKFKPDLVDFDFKTESIWCKIKIKSMPYIIGSLYREPSAPIEYYNLMLRDLEFVDSLGFDVILVGDLNFNCFTNNTYIPHQKIRDIEDLYDMRQLIRSPTRCALSSSTLLDVIFCSNNLSVLHSDVVHTTLSDHFAVCCVLKVNHVNNTTRSLRSRNYRKFVQNDFISELHQSDIFKNLYDCTDVISAWNLWKSEYMRICNIHAPIQERRVKSVPCPWFSEHIINLIYDRDYAHKNAKCSHKLEDWNHYKQLRNKVTSEIRKEKSKFYSHKIDDNRNNPKKMWAALKPLLSKSKSTANVDNISANSFNQFFSTVGRRITEKFDDNDLPEMNIPKVES
jgi:hypothetical protein